MRRMIARILPKSVKVRVRETLTLIRDSISELLGQGAESSANPPPDAGSPCLDRIVLDDARKNFQRANSAASNLPSPGSRWGGYAAWTREHINGFRTIIDTVRFAQQQIGFEMRAIPPMAQEMVAASLNSLRSAYPEFADAISATDESRLSEFSDPNPIAMVDGTRHTTSQLLVVGHLFYAAKRLGHVPQSVLEIGGGYGTPARAWLTSRLGDVRQFVILDLPESIFFAEVFLKAHFGLDQVVNLADPAAGEHVAKAKVVLCPVQMMPRLKSFKFELAINTGSMQEMTDEWIDVYMGLLSELDCTYFYSANYFLQPIDRMNESMNLLAPRLGKDWTLEDYEFYPATVESDLRSSLLSFYTHIPDQRYSVESIQATTDRLRAEVAPHLPSQQDGRDVAYLMDVFRRHPSVELALTLARLLSSNFSIVCKESAFVVNWLQMNGDNLLSQDAEELASLRLMLEKLRASGNEGRV